MTRIGDPIPVDADIQFAAARSETDDQSFPAAALVDREKLARYQSVTNVWQTAVCRTLRRNAHVKNPRSRFPRRQGTEFTAWFDLLCRLRRLPVVVVAGHCGAWRDIGWRDSYVVDDYSTGPSNLLLIRRILPLCNLGVRAASERKQCKDDWCFKDMTVYFVSC